MLERGSLDLTHPLAREAEPPADALEGQRLLAAQSEAQRDHRALAIGQVLEHAGQVRAGAEHRGQARPGHRARVLYRLAEVALAVAAGGFVERDRMLAQALELLQLRGGAAPPRRHLLPPRRPP